MNSPADGAFSVCVLGLAGQYVAKTTEIALRQALLPSAGFSVGYIDRTETACCYLMERIEVAAACGIVLVVGFRGGRARVPLAATVLRGRPSNPRVIVFSAPGSLTVPWLEHAPLSSGLASIAERIMTVSSPALEDRPSEDEVEAAGRVLVFDWHRASDEGRLQAMTGRLGAVIDSMLAGRVVTALLAPHGQELLDWHCAGRPQGAPSISRLAETCLGVQYLLAPKFGELV